MARKKKIPLSERLSQIDSQIHEKEDELKKLKAERKELLEEKKKEEMEELYDTFLKSEKTIEEVRNFLI